MMELMCESGITCPTNSIHGQVGHGTPVFYLKKEKTSVNACKQTIYRGFRVPEAGLEPARLYRPRDFKSLVSTNSTTQALSLYKKSRFHSGPCGAENETRTRDPDLGKVVLYQLSYFRLSFFDGAKIQLFCLPHQKTMIFFFKKKKPLCISQIQQRFMCLSLYCISSSCHRSNG